MSSKSFSIWSRFLRLKLSPWLTLMRSSYRAIRGCPRGQSRWMMAIAKLNLLPIYDLLDDLIRYPPY
ncbi:MULTISPECIES: hypothetical protein [Leptolyngbya]|uniref:hypothetical protein n=1 Tax=Leptolyngbya TaxID=47251 RepID=UPI001683CEA3|nr:hypothetical protein [Leptolyngbya sp. FACHB-1624]MBD1857747.1 hypothetical protein [Leptolyngbya sp. FACHB-1624]